MSYASLETGEGSLTSIRVSISNDMLPRLCLRTALVSEAGIICLKGGARMNVVDVDVFETVYPRPQPEADSSSLLSPEWSLSLEERRHATLAVRHQWHL